MTLTWWLALKVGAGVAILPERLVRDEVAQGELAAVPFENGQHTVPVAALYRRHRRLPSALRQFIDFLKQPEPGEIPSLAGAGDALRPLDGRRCPQDG